MRLKGMCVDNLPLGAECEWALAETLFQQPLSCRLSEMLPLLRQHFIKGHGINFVIFTFKEGGCIYTVKRN